MKKIVVILCSIAFLANIFTLSCSSENKNTINESEKSFVNPYSFVGKEHNNACKYYFTAQGTFKTSADSLTEKMDFESIISVLVEYSKLNGYDSIAVNSTIDGLNQLFSEGDMFYQENGAIYLKYIGAAELAHLNITARNLGLLDVTQVNEIKHIIDASATNAPFS